MSKNMLKFYAVVVLTLVFIYAFSASYTSDSVDNISYVIALAVDVNEGEQNLQVTFEFMDTSAFSSEQSGDSKGAIIDTVTSTSINSAINLLNAYIGKEVNLSHCKVVVFSDKLAEKGISSEVSELMNNIQVRPSTNIIICKGNALEYIQNSTSQLEKILTKYYDIFPNSSEYTGYTSNIMIGEFYNYLTTKECGNLAILGGLNPTISPSNSSGNPSNGSSGGSSSGSNKSSEGGSSEKSSENSSKENSESTEKPDNNNNLSQVVSGSAPILGERGTENIGLAVLKDGIYRGDLTAIDTLCHTLIKGEVNSFLLTINNTEIYKNYIDVSLYENNPPKITINISENEPVINIKIKLVGRISNLKDGINYSDESTNLDLNEISDAVNRSLEGYIYDYLKKTSSEFKCDIDYFYNYAKRNFKTIYDWRNYDWGSKYEKSKFNVSVESQVYYSLLNSD
ncbi:MAG: Ger(x)C family spore germination C-terminal domain-containing protein [Clostridia bacterium]|nr:Ger(x)C family spore germination C-terminal domain-containing protein [Clostridia bacterium]